MRGKGEILSSEHRLDRVKYWLIIITTALVGVALIFAGNDWAANMKGEIDSFVKVVPKTVVDIGIGFLVAACVSAIFDVAIHRLSFLKPIEGLSEEVQVNAKNLIDTVGEFNHILKSAHELKVRAIYRRQSDPGMSEWRMKVENAVREAGEFVYIAGRTLEELFPAVEDDKKQSISDTIRSKLQGEGIKKVRFVLANSYDRESPFRKECRVRRDIERTSSSSLFQPARFTAQKILGIIRELGISDNEVEGDEGRLRLRISNLPVPYAFVMTENILLIQHYLPYTNGRYGVVLDITKGGTDRTNVYNLYKESYEEFFRKSLNCKPELVKYVKRKSESKEETKEERLYLQYMKVGTEEYGGD